MEDFAPLRIATPDLNLDALSFAATNPEALAEWVSGLPVADTAQTATLLKQATAELAQLKIDYQGRLELLEALRPTLEYVCTRLDNNAVKSNDHEATFGQLAQRLQANLAVGYKSVITAALEAVATDRAVLKDVLPLALHRALSEMSRILLRSLQLYVPPTEHLWLELNQLFTLAERLGIAGTIVVDDINQSNHKTSVQDAYLRAVMLAASKPNQLRHRELTFIFNALEDWTTWVEIKRTDPDAFLVVDVESDHGPKYVGIAEQPSAPRMIRTDILAFEIEAFLKEIDSKVSVPDYLSAELLSHLVDAWGVMRKRVHARAPGTGKLKICIGLNDVHYFLSGAVAFRDQLSATDAMLKREVNPFLAEETFGPEATTSGDPWDQAFDVGARMPENPNIEDPERIIKEAQAGAEVPKPAAKSQRPKHQFFDTQVLDTSPGGYCIQWSANFPKNLQTGELIGIRETEDARWCIAVVRWIRPSPSGAITGIELLAPRAIPVAARVIMKKGGPTDYTRALLLPALKAIDQPSMLITPRLPYQSGHKVHVQRQGIQTTAQLAEEVIKTESFNQFTFRMLDGYLENAQIDLNMENLSEMIGDDAPEPRK